MIHILDGRDGALIRQELSGGPEYGDAERDDQGSRHSGISRVRWQRRRWDRWYEGSAVHWVRAHTADMLYPTSVSGIEAYGA